MKKEKTDAEVELTHAKGSIQFAIINLSEIVVKRCNGWDEWKAEYRAELSKALADLLSIRERLES